MMNTFRTTAALTMAFSFAAFGQIEVSHEHKLEHFVKDVLLGPGVEVGKIRAYYKPGAVGKFQADSSLIGLKNGLILSTGHCDSIHGPNDKRGMTSHAGDYASRTGMKRHIRELRKICRSRVNDAVIIEFEFVPVNNVLTFQYVFASEEYPEYAGSGYNDGFAFLLKGPGIRKPKNLAVFGPEDTPVAINTINKKKNKEYYRKNGNWFQRRKMARYARRQFPKNKKRKPFKFKDSLFRHFQYDGMTKVMTAQCQVIPYRKYRIKLAIADAGDDILDSSVFLEGNSFASVVDTSGVYYSKWVKAQEEEHNVEEILGMEEPEPELPIEVEEEIDDAFYLTDIYFSTNSFEIPDSSKHRLNVLSDYLEQHPKLKCTITGFTDSRGSKRHNFELSEDRAEAVMNYLIERGVRPSRLNFIGLSWQKPRGSNDTDSGRQLNRRVEIELN